MLFGVTMGVPYSGENESFEFHSLQGYSMAILALAALISLVLALLFSMGSTVLTSKRLLLLGYILAAGVFTWRATLAFIEIGPLHPSPWISTGIAIACGLSFWSEGLLNDRNNSKES